jgi:hypothetical protein
MSYFQAIFQAQSYMYYLWEVWGARDNAASAALARGYR